MPDPTERPDAVIPAGIGELLAGEETRLRAQLSELGGGESELAVDDNFADSGQVAAEEGENRALAAELRDQLDDVERARARLDDGTYGVCEVCSQPISAERMDAIPTARFCIEHAD